MFPHLIPLPQKRQLVAVDGTFHHMDVVVFDTEIQISKPKHDTGDRKNTQKDVLLTRDA